MQLALQHREEIAGAAEGPLLPLRFQSERGGAGGTRAQGTEGPLQSVRGAPQRRRVTARQTVADLFDLKPAVLPEDPDQLRQELPVPARLGHEHLRIEDRSPFVTTAIDVRTRVCASGGFRPTLLQSV